MIDPAELQGGMLRGYRRHGLATFIFARVTEPGAAREALARLADEVTPEADWDAVPDVTRNVWLSHRALRALELPATILDGFPADYAQGMAARALGDPAPYALADLEVVVNLQATTEDAFDRAREALDLGAGLQRTGEQVARQHADQREHFGFTDGFSQPAIAGGPRADVVGQGVPYRRVPWLLPRLRPLRWRAVAVGEFVLGNADEDGDPPPAPPAPFDRDASYVVLRRLRQDVAGFRAQLASEAARLGMDEQLLAARIVGRWRDGSPLALRPEGGDPRVGNDAALANGFAYASDPEGRRCPLGAHVRRVNPRDALGWEGRLTARHRILRRGMPYGPRLPEGAADDGEARGLMFVSMQASIARQFETIQRQWCNDGNAFGLGHEPDPIAGSDPARTASPIVATDPPKIAGPLRSHVTCEGGEYLLAPSRAALRALPSL